MSSSREIITAMLIATSVMPTAAVAQSKDEAPAAFKALLDCQTISDGEERLACYDREVVSIEAARKSKDLVIADRDQVREAKRGLFGLALPQMKLFSRDGEEEISEIESSIAQVRSNSLGKYVLVLEDGARWAQTDTRPIQPKVGDKVRIRQAAMGSYLANINGGTAVRVRREN